MPPENKNIRLKVEIKSFRMLSETIMTSSCITDGIPEMRGAYIITEKEIVFKDREGTIFLLRNQGWEVINNALHNLFIQGKICRDLKELEENKTLKLLLQCIQDEIKSKDEYDY